MMSVAKEFRRSLETMESFLPLVKEMADTESAPMWKSLKQESGVRVLELPVSAKSHNERWAKILPHMVKGAGTYPLSVQALYRFIVKQDFAFRQRMDPLIQIWDILGYMPDNHNHQLYLYHANFKPPTKFVAPRDFVFIGQTYLLDKEGKEIPLPPGDDLEDFIDENIDRIQRIIMLNRSVEEQEIDESQHKHLKLDPKKTVRGFIRCIANVMDKVDDNSCNSQLLCDMDPGGYIPEWLKGYIAQHNANNFIKLKSYIEANGPVMSVAVK